MVHPQAEYIWHGFIYFCRYTVFTRSLVVTQSAQNIPNFIHRWVCCVAIVFIGWLNCHFCRRSWMIEQLIKVLLPSIKPLTHTCDNSTIMRAKRLTQPFRALTCLFHRLVKFTRVATGRCTLSLFSKGTPVRISVSVDGVSCAAP